MAKKWSRLEKIVVVAIGLMFAMVVVVTTVMWHDTMKPWTYYEADILSGWNMQTWANAGPDPVLYLLASDPTAGVLSETPTDPTFRGVIITGPNLPENGTIEDYRVLRDGYYIEFADGSMRYVYDPAPWLALRDEVQSSIDPRLWQALVDEGVT